MAIKYENGHYRSHRPVNETTDVLMKELSALTSRQRAAVEEIVRQYGVKGKPSAADIAEHNEWDPNTGPPIPIRQWVNDKYYLGETSDTLFPRLKEDMVELFEGNYYECILCLHPDTRVPLLDGTTPTIKELADRWAVDPTPFWVYGNENGVIVPAMAQEPRQTGVDDYFRVTLEDGTSFSGNARHQMVMRDGSKRMIRDMVIGDSIMPFTVRLSGQNATRGLRGYEQVFDPGSGRWLFTHRIVAADQCKQSCTDATTIHHKNFKKLDNRPENLEWMRSLDHSRMHGEHVKRLNLAGQASRAGKLAWKNRSLEAKAAFSAMMAERNKTMGDRRVDVTLDAIKQSGATNINEAAERLECSPTRIRRVLAEHGLTQTSFFGDRRGKRRGSADVTPESIQSAIDDGSKTPAAVAARLGCAKTTVYRELKKHDQKWSDLCELVGNHYVAKIERIGSGPVYCMTVPRTTNFAISTSFDGKEVPTRRAGVFSSNTGSIGWG